MNQLTLRTRKKLVWLCILSISLQILAPIPAYALTSGPNQPEFSSFEPVATTSMVNEFTGDFTYNLPVIEVPGPEGSGYALSLSYHSGTSPEEEASWVGYGWTLNPGAILRNKQGFPDDFKGEEVKYYNDVPPTWTVTTGASAGEVEAFSADVPLSANASIRYNNYKGFSYTAGLGLHVRGIVSLGYSVTDGQGSFSYSVNPAALLTSQDENAQDDQTDKDEEKQTMQKVLQQSKKFLLKGGIKFLTSKYGKFSKNSFSLATNTKSYSGFAVNFSGSLEGTPSFLPVGAEVGLFGSHALQIPLKEQTLPAFGYLYAGDAEFADAVQDYYLEKESPYHKRDKFLAIPFSNPDYFSVTGEGLGGSFRLRNKNAGHFFPNATANATAILNVGVEFQAGPNTGVGADTNVPAASPPPIVTNGSHGLAVSKWEGFDEDYNFASPGDGTDEAAFFRFKNDLGGSISFGDNDNPIAAGVNDDQEPDLSALDFDAAFQANGYNATQFHGRSGRSSYIGYHTNEEMKLLSAGEIPYQSYTKDAAARNFVDRQDPAIENGIGEITTTNEDGYTYTFGLPVYARNEANLQYGFKNFGAEDGLIVHEDIQDESNIKLKVGEERETPYATSFLLTGITSPDYIDRDLDGPTSDDFGAYTRFVYKRQYGSENKSDASADWYRWRMPYTGFSYNRNSLSDKKDDACSVAYGEKEVYYLDTIETKTHLAVFHTSPRADGIGAAEESVAAENNNPAVTDHLLKLDSITLHARNPEDGSIMPQWLQRVNFSYYDPDIPNLMPELPNSNYSDQGKLTLRKVWTDYNGVVEAKIAPYEFEYEYPEVPYPAPYEAWSNYGLGMEQNPSYDPVNLDAWGNYQSNGAERYDNIRHWVDQRDNPEFDPAAWQLKVIQLPSGGEIHVQYEQKEYQYVQDRRAMAMVSLRPGGDEETFILELADLGIDIADLEKVIKLKALIHEEFITKKEKIYFKILYALSGEEETTVDDCNSEFISGYAMVREVDINDEGELTLLLGDAGVENSLPVEICRDFVQTNRGGIVPGDCNPDGGLNVNSTVPQMMQQLISFWGTAFSGGAVNCKKRTAARSYFRIPVLEPKKGGGIRVKRLLMYDQSLGEKVLYGNEYIYETIDEIGDLISTGVALNEPTKIREENALVTNLEKRTDQDFFERIFAGKDKMNFEGPMGETILPMAAIGYSKVIVKNIHSGRTSPGFTVNEFYTAKDYPFDGYYSELDRRGVELTEINEGDKEWLMIPAVLFNYFKSNLWLTQGFSFIQNDFHGKPRRIASYSGPHADIHNPAAVAKVSEQYYEYFEPGENIPVSMGLDNAQVSYEDLGKETEVIFESRKIEDIAIDQNIEGDLSVGLLPIPPTFVTAMPSYTYSESKLHTHVTVKVTSYPAIVRSIRSYQDGVYTYTKNLQFSRENGRPILTRTTDGYNGLDLEQSPNHQGYYTTYQYAAADIYPALGQKALNEQRTITANESDLSMEKTMAAGSFYLTITGPQSADATPLLQPGDLIQLDGLEDFYHVGERNGNQFTLHPLSNLPHLLVSPLEGEIVSSLKILESGRANRLNEDAGQLVVYGVGINLVDENYAAATASREAFAAFLTDLIQTNPLSAEPITLDYPDEVDLALLYENPVCECEKSISYQTSSNASGTYSTIKVYCTDKDIFNCFMTIPRSQEYQTDFFTYSTEEESLLYYRGDNPAVQPYVSTCEFCPREAESLQYVAGVVDVGLSTYSDQWPLPSGLSAIYISNLDETYSPYEIGARGKWRPNANYVYREDVIPGVDEPAADTDNRVYKQAGTFTMEVFDWNNLANNDPDKWIQLNQTTLYSPHGQALEEENIQGIKSVAKYGYNHTMPYLIAQNADYGSVYFESFENDYSNNEDYAFNLEDGASYSPDTIDNRKAHAGAHSLRLEVILKDGLLESSYTPKTFRVSNQIKDNGVKFQVWVKTRDRASRSINTFSLLLDGFTSDQTVDFLQIARSGEWVLYEAKVLPESFVPYSVGEVLYPKLHFDLVLQHLQYEIQGTEYVNIQDEIWIDDLRYQPLDAQMNCFVYDPATYRLLTSFDDQHFGLFYQYNAQGQLVRKMVETERGLKTVQETQYHTPLTQLRNQD